MGLTRIKTLADLRRLDAHLRVTCRSCGHYGVYPLEQMVSYFLGKGWNSAWSEAPRRFRCDRCGERNAQLDPEPKPLNHVPATPAALTEREWRAEVRRRRG